MSEMQKGLVNTARDGIDVQADFYFFKNELGESPNLFLKAAEK